MLNDDKEAESYDLREDQCQSTNDTTTKVSKTKENLQESLQERLQKSPGQKETRKQQLGRVQRKMTKGSSHTCFRGVYTPTSPSKYQSYTVLGYKLPLNNKLKKKFGLHLDDYKYHYDTANKVLCDFQGYHAHYFHK